MDIFLVLYEAERLSLATHWSCAFVIFSGSFLIPLSLLKGPGFGGGGILGSVSQDPGVKLPWAPGKTVEIHSQHLQKVFPLPQKQYPRPIKASSGGSGTQEH